MHKINKTQIFNNKNVAIIFL